MLQSFVFAWRAGAARLSVAAVVAHDGAQSEGQLEALVCEPQRVLNGGQHLQARHVHRPAAARVVPAQRRERQRDAEQHVARVEREAFERLRAALGAAPFRLPHEQRCAQQPEMVAHSG